MLLVTDKGVSQLLHQRNKPNSKVSLTFSLFKRKKNKQLSAVIGYVNVSLTLAQTKMCPSCSLKPRSLLKNSQANLLEKF